jgi:hypothetical protein
VSSALRMAQEALRKLMGAALQRVKLTPRYAVSNYPKIEASASDAALARRSFVTAQAT